MGGGRGEERGSSGDTGGGGCGECEREGEREA